MSKKTNCRKYPNGGHGIIGYVQHRGLYMVWLHHNLEMFKVYYLILGIQFLPPWSNMWTTILAIRIVSWELLVACYSFGHFFLQPCLHLQSNLSTSKIVEIKDLLKNSYWWDVILLATSFCNRVCICNQIYQLPKWLPSKIY